MQYMAILTSFINCCHSYSQGNDKTIKENAKYLKMLYSFL